MMNEQQVIPYYTTNLCGHRVLVLAPHPDDETFGCGGALLLHRRQQDAVRVIFLTSGEAGDWQGGTDPEEFRARREAEAVKALACLGVIEWEFWRYPDRGVAADGRLINRLSEAIRAHGATLVYVPSPLEQHPDHRAVAHALRAALRGWVGKLQIGFYEVGYALPPNTLVDISAVWATKVATIQTYESQVHGPNYLAVNQGLSHFRALTLGSQVMAAEAFRVVPVTEIEHDAIWQWQALQILHASAEHPLPVSVIVRTKDRPTFLRDALGSLTAQTFHDFEVVVVNDGGSDISAIIAEYPGLQCTFVQFPQNQGRAAAANAGVEAARGTFITYLDDDDVYYPAHLETLYTFLSAHDHFGVVYTDAAFTTYRLNDETARYEVVDRHLQSSEDFDRDVLLYHNPIPNLCLMHRRDAWARVGKFDASLTMLEDWDFFLRLAREYPFHHISRCTSEYRLRNDGTNLSVQKPWMSNDEINARTALYRRYRDYHTPEVEVRVFGKLLNEVLTRRAAAEEQERLRQRVVELEDKLRHLEVQERPPLVSVLIPTKNGERYLDELLSAIATQQGEVRPLEVIAVDSGSRDRTLAILLRHQVRILQISPEAFSHGTTRNLLASQARGEFLVFLTQDASPVNDQWLQNLIAPVRADARVAGGYSRQLPRANCHPMEWRRIVEEEFHGQVDSRVHSAIDNREDYERNPWRYRFFANTSAVLRRSVWEQIPFPEIAFAEDQAWADQVMKAGYKTTYAADSVVYHSHSYGPWVNFCRHFEHAVAMQHLFAHFSHRRLKDCIPEALSVAKRDLIFWRRQTNQSKVRVLGRWALPAISWHVAANLGTWLGERASRLPEPVVRSLSLQEQVKKT
jgi:glycosyltransferase involved in cell wall biosynthesis/LmbE family N-acetylglucosaminyl deacetylase